ncbi:hypothetical protein CfE428DRAFT_6419 [Chthoniobacter flavus Ellin428]|uniref:Uncharacterized protein n=1 Tax=Chthoniobacter flavus Ellin428 TaxID=497964 RepID=B4DBX8_9BACT|nr:hypothetical protein CfE428DRAFT_6419 [Chthoniobacter flavus Ellin428]TCO87755.1 hypothetical protein EV701_12054 [Chthoniobacter flavus]
MKALPASKLNCRAPLFFLFFPPGAVPLAELRPHARLPLFRLGKGAAHFPENAPVVGAGVEAAPAVAIVCRERRGPQRETEGCAPARSPILVDGKFPQAADTFQVSTARILREERRNGCSSSAALCVLRSANHENVRTTRRIFGPRITQITRMRADHSRHSGDSRVTFPSLSFRMFVAPLLVAASPRRVLCV